MSVVKKRSPFPFLELDELAQIHVLQYLAPRDIQSARLTCFHLQNLVDYEVGINVVVPQFNRKQNSRIEYEKIADAVFQKKVHGLRLSFVGPSPQPSPVPTLPVLQQLNDLESITITGVRFTWLETLLTSCKNLRKISYYTLKTYQREPSAETRPLGEIINGFRNVPYTMDKLESLSVKLSSRTNDYICPMFLLFGGIKASKLKTLHIEVYMGRSITVEEPNDEEDEIQPTTAQRCFAYICYGRAIEFLSQSPNLFSLKVSLEGEMIEEQMEHPLPTHVQSLLNQIGSETLKTKLVAIRNRNWERLRTIQEWVENLPGASLRKLSFNVTVPEDVEILTVLLGRQMNLRTLKVYIEPWNFIHNQGVLRNILRAVSYPERMEVLTISHYFQAPLDFRATFEDFTHLKLLKLHNCGEDGRIFHFLNRHTPVAIPTVHLKDGYMSTQLFSSIPNLAMDFLTNLEVIDLKDLSASPLEMRRILELPMLRKIRLCVKKYAMQYKCFGIYSSDLVRAMLTMRRLEYIRVEPVIFREEKRFKIEVMNFENSGSIVVPDDCQFLKSVGKLVLEADSNCPVYNGKYTLTKK
ncbi:unnamed protein product [Orchesella dallaii]|uniref:F-box domain-containing protein n=1 Tax=Orchesella dallaii TaxID=48710 RepID=A0ABP1S433_9HEXA